MRKRLLISLSIAALVGFCPQVSLAQNYSGTLTGLLSAMSATGTNSFSATGDISLSSASLGSMSGDDLTLTGNLHTLDGISTYSGITVGSGKTLNINNFGSLNGDGSVNTAIQNFKSSTNGGALNNAGTLNVDNSVFYNNTNSTSGAGNVTVNSFGGAIYNAGTANITNSSFYNNIATVTVTAPNSGTPTAKAYGGGIYSSTGNMTITDSSFKQNSAQATAYNTAVTGSPQVSYSYGGALYNDNATVSVRNSSFSGNNASSNSYNTRPQAYSYGGAIYNNTGTVNLFNTNLSENYASSIVTGSVYRNTYAYGGAIYNASGALSIFGGNLSNNYTSTVQNGAGAITNQSYGGAIYNSGTAKIFNATFDSNNSDFGGAVYSSTGNIDFYNDTFTSNTATTNGGALSLDAGTYNIFNSSFTGNTALSAGSIYNNASTLSIFNTQFKNNIMNSDKVSDTVALTVNYAGSAIYDNTSSSTLIRDSKFSDNSIVNKISSTSYNQVANSSGGSIYSRGPTIINDTSFLNNYVNSTTSGSGAATSIYSNTYGGAIYNTSALSISHDLFDSNYAYSDATAVFRAYSEAHGGAIYSTGSLNVLDTIFSNNYISIVANAGTSIYKFYSYGGAIYNSGTLNISDSSFLNNKIFISPTGFLQGNQAYQGGAIFQTAGASSIQHTIFKNNITPGHGGAIFNNSLSSSMSIDNSIFQNNSATSYAGAIFNTTNAKSNIINSEFSSNHADTGGGAIYSGTTSAYLNISNDIFKDNSSSAGGGAIYTNGNSGSYCVTNINDSIFSKNSATVGGAIYMYQYSTINVANSSFSNDITSATGASSIYTYINDNLSLLNDRFTNDINENSSSSDSAAVTLTMSGGAIYKQCAGNIFNSKFSDNSLKVTTSSSAGNSTSTTSGGALWSSAASTIYNTEFKNNAVYSITQNTSAASVGYAYAYSGAMTNSSTNSLYNCLFDNNLVSVDVTAILQARSTAYGGAINSSGTLNIYDTVFTNNKAKSNINVTNTAFSILTYGGAIYNSGVANIYNSYFDNNSISSSVTAGSINANGVSGGAIYNGGTLNIYDSLFSNNIASSSSSIGGAIGNNATTNIYNSVFENNSARNGGVIYNNIGGSCNINITNSKFLSNVATTSGGAIYANYYANIIADKGISLFSGNKANNISNAIYMYAGRLNLNAGNGGYILFNDKITDYSIGTQLYINSTGDGTATTGYLSATAPTTGNVIFNEQLTNATMSVNGGMLTLGQYGNTKLTASDGVTPATSYFNNVALTLNGGILNSANGNIDTNFLASLTSSASAGTFFDANLSTGANDKYTVTAAPTGSLTIDGVNILADGTNSTLTLFTGAKSPTFTYPTGTSFNAYTNVYKYTFSNNATAGVLDVARNSVASGIVSATTDASTYRSFSLTSGYTQTAHWGTMGGTNATLTLFGNQHSMNSGNYGGTTVNDNFTLNMYNFGQYSNEILSDSVNGYKSRVFMVNGGKVNLYNDVFYNNNLLSGNGGITYVGSGGIAGTLSIYDSTFLSNSASAAGGAIYNNAKTYAYNTTFNHNIAGTSGGAICNGGVLLYLDSDIFKLNEARDSGGAIYNSRVSATINAVSSSFESNLADVSGGALYNSGTFNILNSTFTGNTAGVSGGAIYNSGTLYIQASNGNTTFSLNTANSIANDLHLAGGNVYLNGGAEGVVTFSSGISSSAIANAINIDSPTGSANLQGGTFNFNCPISTTTLNVYNGTTNFNNSILSNDIINIYGGMQNFTNSNLSTDTRVLVSNTASTAASASITNISGSTLSNHILASGNGGVMSTNSTVSSSGAANSVVNISGNSTFASNSTSSGNGGAISNYSQVDSTGLATSMMTIAGSQFTSNSSSANGGAIYNYALNSSTGEAASSLKITNSVLKSNTASGNGGAIFNSSLASSTGLAFANLEIIGSNFGTTSGDGNSAVNGGAIYNTNSAKIIDTSFKYNNASNFGGAIYNSGVMNIIANGADSLFTNNTSTNGGNDIYLAGGTLYLNAKSGQNITFNSGILSSSASNSIYINSSNILMDDPSTDATEYAPTDGTVNFSCDISSLNLKILSGLANFNNHNLSNVFITAYGGDSLFLNTDFVGGTRLRVESTSGTSSVQGSRFQGTAYVGSGGGIYLKTGNLDINSTDLSNYTASAYGGAIYNDAGILNINNLSSLSGNSSIKGGAIYNIGTTTVNHSSFTGNTVASDGGAIYNEPTATLTVANASSLTGNTATNGGAIYNAGTSNVSGSSFTSNIATTGNGGAIYNSGTLTVSNTSFNTNTANSGLGGAIYNTGTLNIQADGGTTLFSGNTDSTGSNGIYSTGNVYLNTGDSASTGTVGTITFNDAVKVAAANLYINSNGVSAVLNNGITIFNNKVTANNIYIYNGTNNFNSDVIANLINIGGGTTYFNSNVDSANITVDSGVVNFTSNIDLSTITSNGGTINFGTSSITTYENAVFNFTVGNIGFNNVKFLKNSKLTVSGSGASATLTNATLNGIDYTGTNSALSVIGGTLNINTSTFSNYLTATNGGVINNADALVVKGSTLVNNSAVNGGAIYNTGTATASEGSIFTSNNATSSGGVIYNDSGATFTISNSSFASNNAVNGGAIENLGNVILNDSSFTSNSSTTKGGAINNNIVGSLDITNTVFKGNNSDLGGAIYNNGTAIITGSTFGGNSTINDKNYANSGGAVYNDTNGVLNLSSSSFTNNSALIGGALYNKGLATITGTSFTGNTASTGDGGAILNSGNLELINSNLTNNQALNGLGGAIYNSGTFTYIADASNTTVAGNQDSTGFNAVYLTSGSTLNLNAGNNGTLTLNDKITSDAGATININKTNIALSAGGFAPSNGNITFNNTVSGDLNLYGGTLSLSHDNLIDGNNMNFNGGTLNMINNSVGTMALNSVNFANGATTNLGLDADLANNAIDIITATSVGASTGIINVNNINMLSDATNKNTSLTLADANLKDHVSLGLTTVNAPIYKYDLTYNPTTGQMNFMSSKPDSQGGNFNPAVLSSPVASLVGAFMNQTNVYSEALGRAEVFMSLPQTDRMLMRYNNKYAAVGGVDVQPEVFSPTFLPEERGGSWVKQYTTIENIPLNNGPRVSNVGYGILVGNDTPMYHLKHGYDGYLTAFMGYNGSHQNYDQVGVYQNGAALGLTGTLYKGNFFTALTASIADSNGSASTMYGTDNFNTVIAGAAWKAGYNFEMMRGKLIIQPSYSMSYTFANTFDYTNAAGVNITSQPLNAVQISPGVKVIANCKNGWQPYIGANMVWNIMDTQKFYANDAQLPQMSVAPYVEYGVGLQRRWGERFTGFGQTMFRGGGRNGVAFQFGFRWAIGK